jgi:hypothetical protein
MGNVSSSAMMQGVGADQTVKYPSKLPLFVGIVLFLTGSSLVPAAFYFEARWLFVVGYVLTPLSILICVAWDSLSQRAGSKNPWFAVSKGLSRSIRILAGVSFLPALAHIWFISDWLGELAVQNGWF